MNFEKMIDGMIAERIINARKSRKLTQEAFCDKFSEKVSLDKFRLSNLENGKRNKKEKPPFFNGGLHRVLFRAVRCFRRGISFWKFRREEKFNQIDFVEYFYECRLTGI